MTELLNYISDPENSENNFKLGLWYEDQGHTAAAAGFYLRTAEYSSNALLCYEALLRMANCFTKQGGRVYITKGILLRAISLMPKRPEAYFLLSRLYEVNKDWQEAYAFSIMGQGLCEEHPRLRTNVDYPGPYALVFEQAVAAWWIGLFSESLHLFRQLKRNPNMIPIHVVSVQNNLKNLEGTVWRDPNTYYSSMYERLKVKFPGAIGIERNYSQCYQDMFVLTMLNGKGNGIFFEIGCGDPEYGNNTKLLEQFGWKGTSIDIDPEVAERFHKERLSYVITGDATKLDYGSLITTDYDYLQIDCDPAANSLETLLRIPFEKVKFSVITFEHDGYCTDGIRERSRKYLESHGYMMVVGDISPDNYMNFEDWWVHPEKVDQEILRKMQDTTEGTKRAEAYMIGG